MDPKDYLSVYGVVVTILLVLFWRSRDGSLKPSKLNMKKGPKGASQVGTNAKGLSQDADDNAGERMLNVMFNFNGYSWDAYEVLGIPAGSTTDRVKSAHSQLIANSKPSSRALYDKALQSILSLEKNQSSASTGVK